MSDVPLRCVVDTNVALTANGANPGAGASCAANCATALLAISNSGHVFVDNRWLILGEYGKKLRTRGQLGPGDLFYRWLLTNDANVRKVTHVAIMPRPDDPTDFEELPDPPSGVRYDPSDRKFLAVAAAHRERPPILQAMDSKWWGWCDALAKIGVHVHFLCESEIQQKHRKKMKG